MCILRHARFSRRAASQSPAFASAVATAQASVSSEGPLCSRFRSSISQSSALLSRGRVAPGSLSGLGLPLELDLLGASAAFRSGLTLGELLGEPSRPPCLSFQNSRHDMFSARLSSSVAKPRRTRVMTPRGSLPEWAAISCHRPQTVVPMRGMSSRRLKSAKESRLPSAGASSWALASAGSSDTRASRSTRWPSAAPMSSVETKPSWSLSSRRKSSNMSSSVKVIWAERHAAKNAE
mmetsp:Transcript_26313/g.68684  ORF Transcript_26313/g.68684 Transcript_26313/m.68684 type:complete len:236 (+) Transcript_26313:160-867(+)